MLGLPGALWGRGEEVRFAVAESLLFLLLVASLLSVKGALNIPPTPAPSIYHIPKTCKKKKSCYLPFVCHASQPVSRAAPAWASQFDGCCRTVVAGVSLALPSTLHKALLVG